MPKYLMLDHGGVLDGSIVTASTVTDNDIVLGQIDSDYIRILRNGVRIVCILNQLVRDHHYQIVYHSSNVVSDQLNIHNELVEGARKKGLIFPNVRVTAAPDSALTNESPENPKVGTLGKTGIPFLSYANTGTSGKNCVRRALASYLNISEATKQKHIIFDDGGSNVSTAKSEGYSAYLIGREGTSLEAALDEILQKELKIPYENWHRAAKVGSSILAGGVAGYVGGSVYVATITTAAGTAATVCGMSAVIFVGLCTVAGAGLLLLLAYAINRCRTGRPGFFSSMLPRISDEEHRELSKNSL
jgi:hypothetical protein